MLDLTKLEHSFGMAERLGKDLIVFDLEHTGGPKWRRGITEIGAIVIDGDGIKQEFSSFVNPGEDVVFNPYAIRKTGITPETVADAPGWGEILNDFVIPQRDAVWVGFASRSSDLPIIREINEKIGVEMEFAHHLDLQRQGGSGKLTERVSHAYPGIDISAAHRALHDASLTLLLMDWMLREGIDLDDAVLSQHDVAAHAYEATQPRSPTAEKAKKASFPICRGSRRGAPWTQEEVRWVQAQFQANTGMDEIGRGVGRTAFAVACNLHKAGLIDEFERDSFNLGLRPREKSAHSRPTA